MTFRNEYSHIKLDSPECIKNPYPFYQFLLESNTLVWHEHLHCWMVSRYKDIVAILQSKQFISTSDRFQIGLLAFPDDVRQQYKEFDAILSNMRRFYAPPQHTGLRRYLHPVFCRTHVDQYRDSIDAYASKFVEQLHPNQADLMNDYARHIPAHIICEFLGIPKPDRQQLIQWSDDFADFLLAIPPTELQLKQANKSVLHSAQYFRMLIRQNKNQEQNGMFHLLQTYQENGHALTEDEIAAQCILFLFGGQKTVRYAISNGIYTLLTNPELLLWILNHRQFLPQLIDELLRIEAPVQYIFRKAEEDTAVAGTTIHAGQYVMLFLGAACRDPSVYDNPDAIQMNRKISSIWFGHGVNKCIGGELAKLEIKVAIDAILDYLPSVKLDEENVEWTQHLMIRGVTKLPVQRKENNKKNT